jgi:hypothetical protein
LFLRSKSCLLSQAAFPIIIHHDLSGHLRELRKSPTICRDICGNSASLPQFVGTFAETPQVSHGLLGHLRKLRRSPMVCWDICGNSASLPWFVGTFAGTPQVCHDLLRTNSLVFPVMLATVKSSGFSTPSLANERRRVPKSPNYAHSYFEIQRGISSRKLERTFKISLFVSDERPAIRQSFQFLKILKSFCCSKYSLI